MKLIELNKFLTRDMPVIAVESWYKGCYRYFQDFFDFNYTLFFIFENGAVSYYTDLWDTEKELPLRIVKWMRTNTVKLKLIHKHLVEGIKFFNNVKIDKNVKADKLLNILKKAHEYRAKGFIGVYITHHIPIFHNEINNKLISKNIINKIIKWREGEGNVFFSESIRVINNLLTEIAQRNKWDFELLYFITLKELNKCINEGVRLPIEELKKRRDSSFMYCNNKIIFKPDIRRALYDDGYFIKEKKVNLNKKVLYGEVSSKGIIEGKAKTIHNINQLSKVNKGDILVAPMTSPLYMEAIQNASAIVTDEGGITCHAAIIARELGKPCITGTKIATKVFKDGDKVLVDATRGIVRKI